MEVGKGLGDRGPELLELKDCLDNALRHKICVLGGGVETRGWIQWSLCVHPTWDIIL